MEDVADNLVCAQLARGEKEGQVVRSLCSTLQNTCSSSEIIATTMMASLRRVLEKEEPDIMKDIGRTMHEQGTESKSKEHFVYYYFCFTFYCIIILPNCNLPRLRSQLFFSAFLSARKHCLVEENKQGVGIKQGIR